MAETNVNDVGGRKVLLSENDRYFDCVGRNEMKETDKFPNIYIYIYIMVLLILLGLFLRV